jgi:hypothetical protein
MKRSLLTILVLVAIGVLVSVVTARSAKRDVDVVDIPEKTKLIQAELLGKYILVHDAEKKANGEACLSVYRYSQARNGAPEVLPQNLVVSFHCVAVDRPKARHLILTYGFSEDGFLELREIQFAGTPHGHRVP